MHDQVRVRQPAVNFLDDAHGEGFTIGLAREFVGAVRGAHRDRKRVDLGLGDEVDRLVGVGEQLVVRQHALGAVSVFLLAGAVFERAEAAKFTLDRDATEMRHFGDLAGDVDIVVIARRRLAVGLERAVHHDGGEARLDRGQARGRTVAVVKVHAHRNVRVDFDQGVDHLRQHDVVGVLAGAAARLDDGGCVDRVGGGHSRQTLFHVVDVEGGDAVAALGGVIQKLPESYACHADLHATAHAIWAEIA